MRGILHAGSRLLTCSMPIYSRDTICPATCWGIALRVTRGDRQSGGSDVQRHRFRPALRAARCKSFASSGDLGDLRPKGT